MDFTDDTPTRYLHRGMAALDLAHAFADELMSGAPDDDRDRFVTTILCAGQHVYDESGPGHWEAFDAAAFEEQMGCADDEERGLLYFDMTSFFGWLAMNALMAPPPAIDILRALGAGGPAGAPHRALAETTIGLLEAVSE